MSYVILSHVATGDLATAALHNTLLDDIAIIKSNINDDGYLNPIRRLKADSGAFVGTTITVVSQVVLPALTALDHLVIRFAMKVGGTFTSDSAQLRHVTDNAEMARLTTGVTYNTGEFFGGVAHVSQDHSGNTKITTFAQSGGDTHPDGQLNATKLIPYTATATWGSGWTLGLGLAQSSGTTDWWWSVILFSGQ